MWSGTIQHLINSLLQLERLEIQVTDYFIKLRRATCPDTFIWPRLMLWPFWLQILPSARFFGLNPYLIFLFHFSICLNSFFFSEAARFWETGYLIQEGIKAYCQAFILDLVSGNTAIWTMLSFLCFSRIEFF